MKDKKQKLESEKQNRYRNLIRGKVFPETDGEKQFMKEVEEIWKKGGIPYIPND